MEIITNTASSDDYWFTAEALKRIAEKQRPF
jgi:hypothetical protein